MPWGSPLVEHILGTGLPSVHPEPVSPRTEEAKIALLTVAVDRVLDRCERTMRHISRTLLCWLRSTKAQTCYSKPCALIALKSSKKKYRQLLKRFFVLIFRCYQIPVDTRRRPTGIRFKKEQLRQIQTI
ncbi:hypothetical protein BKA65DRAFT_486787 [Rhexocercosporidium sp. MPI-PUGE-AT-0058]|nr:hypothetical protein BKA65DRAFT_486787 [Rhexocercosporidium sp. MPI-PUGE-AT-0058]